MSECAAIADSQLRLQCYDELNAERYATNESSAPVKVDPGAVPDPNTTTTASPLSETSDSSQDANSAEQEFGAETIPKKRQETKGKRNELVKAEIVKVRTHHDGRWSVTLDNGQVWRETQGTRIGKPNVGAIAEIKRGALGGYRMNISGMHRTAWVKRTR